MGISFAGIKLTCGRFKVAAAMRILVSVIYLSSLSNNNTQQRSAVFASEYVEFKDSVPV